MPLLARQYRPATDSRALLDLFDLRVQAGVAEASGQDLLDALAARPGSIPYRDAAVVEGPRGTLLGWIDVYLPEGGREADLQIAADPEAGSEVLAALLDAARNRAQKAGAQSLLAYVKAADTATLAALVSSGAMRVSGYVRLSTELSGPQPVLPLPTGTRLEPYAGPTGAKLALAAVEVSWSDLPGHKPATPESIAVALKQFGPAGHLVLLDSASAAVGVVRWLKLDSGEGYVDAPGLAPHLRSQDAYAALLDAAASHLTRAGAQRATLESWGDPPQARAAQAALGWEVEETVDGWRLLVED